METDRTKRNIGARIYIQTLKEKTLMKKPKIKLIELYSSNSNVNINFKKTNFIHLSSLFKSKINKLNQNNSNSCVAGSPKFKSMEKISLKQHKKHYINSLSNYNSLSYKKMSLIKLPKIKNENEINNLVANIFTKFEQVEKNFKEQGKITNFIYNYNCFYSNFTLAFFYFLYFIKTSFDNHQIVVYYNYRKKF